MASLTWVGSVSTDAGNPLNWSGGVLPAPGDSLITTGGTIDVFDNEMAGNTINVENGASATTRAPVIFNIHNNGFVDQNLLDTVSSIGPIIFNVDAGATWSGGYGSTLSPVTVNGPGIWENGMSGMNGSTALVAPAVIGTGQFFVLSAQGQNGVLEFESAVSQGQAVAIAGNPQDGTIGTLVLDDPTQFLGSITLQYGEIALNGIRADSYSYDGNTLNLLSGGSVVDGLRVSEVAPGNGSNGPLSVTVTANGIDIRNDNPTASDIKPAIGGTSDIVSADTLGNALQSTTDDNQLSFISPLDAPASDPMDIASNDLGPLLDDQGVPVDVFAIAPLDQSGVLSPEPDLTMTAFGDDLQTQQLLFGATDPTALPLAA